MISDKIRNPNRIHYKTKWLHIIVKMNANLTTKSISYISIILDERYERVTKKNFI